MSRPVFAVFTCIAFTLSGQNRTTFNIDSLQKVAANTRLPDSSRLAALHDISRSYIYSNPDTVYTLARRELQYAQQIGDKRYEANAYSNMGISLFCRSRQDEALIHYQKALHIWEELPEAKLRKTDKLRIAILYNNSGNVYKSLGDYAKALECHFKSLQLKESVRDSAGMAASVGNIGVLYENMGDHDRALQQYFRCLELFNKMHDSTGISSTYSNIGNLYESLKEYRNALDYEQRALRIKLALGEVYGLANTYNGMGIVYESMGKLDSAMIQHQKSLEGYRDAEDEQGIAIALNNIGRVLMKQKKYPAAEKKLLESLFIAEKVAAPEDVREASLSLSQLYDIMGNYDKAFAYFKKYIVNRDSISNEENTRKSVQTEMNYNFAKKEAIVKAEVEKKEAVVKVEKRRQSIVLAAISSFGILVLAFALFAWKSFREKQRANVEIIAQKRIIEEKQKEVLDSIRYAKRIQESLMPNEKYLEKILWRLAKKI